MWFANWVDVMFECCLVLKNDHQKKQVIALSINWFILIIYCNKQVVVQSQKIIFFLTFTRKWASIVLSKETRGRFLGEYLLFIKRHLKKRFRDFYETIPLKTYMFDQFVQKFIINVSFKFPSTMCRSFWKIIIIRNICDYYNIIIYVTTFNSYKLRR